MKNILILIFIALSSSAFGQGFNQPPPTGGGFEVYIDSVSYNTATDSLYLQRTDGAAGYVYIPTGSGGLDSMSYSNDTLRAYNEGVEVAFAVFPPVSLDSTAILEDSILVSYRNDLEINRDTIVFPTLPIDTSGLSLSENPVWIPNVYGDSILVGNIEDVDACAINEYIHNIKEFRLVFSHENTGLSLRARINGDTVTYENLVNASDAGNGQINFSATPNGVWIKKGNTVETIKKVGDYFELVCSGVQRYRGAWVSLSYNLNNNPHAASEEYRIFLNSSNYQLRNKEDSIISTAAPENGTYRFTRTLSGFKIEKNGVFLYESPIVCNDYTESPPTIVEGNTGYYRLGIHEPATAINTTTNALGTDIVTGLDLTQATGMYLKMTFADQSSSISWQTVEIAVDDIINSFNSSAALDGYLSIYDNDWMRLNLVDLQTGTINLVDQGRDLSYVRAELWLAAEESELFIDVIADFDATTKVDTLLLSDGRNYTLLEDNSAQTPVTQRNYTGSQYPFIEVEFVKDATASHAPFIRSNTPGTGRQSQVRVNVSDGSYSALNSGANTSLPIVHKVTVDEETIKVLIEFTDPTPHTELEIAPAGATSALINSVAQTGQTGVAGVNFYENNPLGYGLPISFTDYGVWNGVDIDTYVSNGILYGNGTGTVTSTSGGTFPVGNFDGTLKVTRIGDWVQQDLYEDSARSIRCRQSFDGGITWTPWM